MAIEGRKFKIRLVALITALVTVASLSVTKLMTYQFVQGDQLLEQAKSKTTTTYTTTAARGDIVDRYGRILATDESVYNVVFNYSFTEKDLLNETILKLMGIMNQYGLEWNNYTPIEVVDGQYSFKANSENAITRMRDTIRQAEYSSALNCVDKFYSRYKINTREKITSFPIVYNGTGYEFSSDYDEGDIEDFKDDYNLAESLTASECIEKLEQNGDVVFYTEEEAFAIACVRYSMERMEFSINNPYTFSKDISTEAILTVKEHSYGLTGVEVVNEPARAYVNQEVATHVLGTVGPIYAEEYDKYKDLGYPMDAIIGKSGIEKTYETELRGTDGEVLVLQDENGDIIEEKIITQAQKGNTVQLTIDSVFQSKIQDIFGEFIAKSTSNHGKYKCTGGAIVVLDVKTGEVLASVTDPTYSVETYKTQYTELLQNDIKNSFEKTNPLLNKAINGQYRPGSTFKPVVAVAGLQEGVITPQSKILCENPYVYYETPYGCLQDHHSGNIDVFDAIKWSCNTFFYKLGDMVGLEKVQEYSRLLGLGVDTGLEIYQEDGRLTEYKNDGSWYIGKIVQAAIGQADTYVTPIQMAVQASTIANKGVRYETHIVDLIKDANDEVVFETKPIVASEFAMTDETHYAVTEGMRMASTKIGGAGSLMDLPYTVAVKTGTPQTIDDDTNNNAFIAFTNIENPDIAIACMAENADKYAYQMIRPIIDAYEESKALGEAELAQEYPRSVEDVLIDLGIE